MKTRTLLLTGLAILIILLVIGRFYFSEEDYNLQNTDWNGLSHLGSTAHVTPLYNTANLAGPGSGRTLLIVSPTKNFSVLESAQVLAFLHGGGRVVVADDFGNADSLLNAIGSPITVDPVLICQYENYYVNKTLPIVTNISSSPYTRNVGQLVLNHPASLNITGDTEVIVSTSDKAWRDYDGNLSLDSDERMGTYPVVARSEYAGGELIVISDPDILVNSMLDKGDNAAFMSDVFTGPVLADVSHGMEVTPVGFIYYVIKLNLWAQVLATVLILCGFIAFVMREKILKRPGSRPRRK